MTQIILRLFVPTSLFADLCPSFQNTIPVCFSRMTFDPILLYSSADETCVVEHLL